MATAKKAAKRKPAAKKKAAKKSNAGTAKLKKIVALAKTEYKKPSCKKKWTTCVKEAAKKLK